PRAVSLAKIHGGRARRLSPPGPWPRRRRPTSRPARARNRRRRKSSHRRHNAATDRDPRGLQRSVGLGPRRSDEDGGTRFQFAPLARHEGDDGRFGGNGYLFLAVLVLDGEHLTLLGGDGLLDVSLPP